MKIFFYTTVFAPSVGGIETLAETLCREFVSLGHEVVLATETPGSAEMPFLVVRQPRFLRFRDLLAWCDVHVQANVSLRAAWVWLVAPTKTVYQHNNVYQRDDGTKRLVDRLKTLLAGATPGIANSSYTAERTGTKDIIFNAYDDATFGPSPRWETKDLDLVFLGRLVSQKGCDTLIDALSLLAARGQRPGLTVIGDGPDRAKLEQQAEELGVARNVRFLGGLKGKALADELARHKIMVVPSRYEEPFGIVALEGMASGCILIVSQRGGLVDAISGHGFTFPNGDAWALADRLEEVLENLQRARGCLDGIENHLAKCQAHAVAERYLTVFKRYLEYRR